MSLAVPDADPSCLLCIPVDGIGPVAPPQTGQLSRVVPERSMQAAGTPLLLTVPRDSPFVPANLAEVLYRTMAATGAGISVAHDGERMQQVYALLRCELLPDLLDCLDNGGRKAGTW